MTTFEEAKITALKKIKEADEKVNWVFEHAVEFNEGWFFYFNSKKYLDTHNIMDRPLGPGPIIVGKENGVVFQSGSFFDEEYWIKKFLDYVKNQK